MLRMPNELDFRRLALECHLLETRTAHYVRALIGVSLLYINGNYKTLYIIKSIVLGLRKQ